MNIRTHKRAIIAMSALALVGTSGFALAQASGSPAQVIQARQQHFKQLGGAFKAVNDETRAATPNLDTIRTNAATVQKLAGELPTWFPAGTGPEAGVPTQAKAEIFANKPTFEEKAKGLQTAAQTLVTASQGTDVAAITAAGRALGGACQGCHMEFRNQPPRPAAPPPAPAS